MPTPLPIRIFPFPRLLAALLAATAFMARPGPAGADTAVASDGYADPQPGAEVVFPRDHGSHPAYRIEWWYITGHLFSETGRRFGFQVTFFRNALRPLAGQAHSGHPGGPVAGRDHLFMAHTGFFDARTGDYRTEERFHRNGWRAWAATNGLDLANGNWRLTALPHAPADSAAPPMKIRATVREGIAYDLVLTPEKPLVRFGQNGISQKGPEPGAASLYLTFPRLRVEGLLSLDGRDIPVTGQAWMDHEISSSQLGTDQAGWDWASIQLQDGREVMLYLLRRKDGTVSPYSTLTWIDTEGRTTAFGPDRFTWAPRRTWTSPHTGAEYPVDIDVTLPDPATGRPRTLRLRPLADAQEHPGTLSGVPYWEGACDVLDEHGTDIGDSFIELTGYAGDLTDRLR